MFKNGQAGGGEKEEEGKKSTSRMAKESDLLANLSYLVVADWRVAHCSSGYLVVASLAWCSMLPIPMLTIGLACNSIC